MDLKWTTVIIWEKLKSVKGNCTKEYYLNKV